jgi:hypothetical protein
MMFNWEITFIINDNQEFSNFLYAISRPNSSSLRPFSSPAARWLLDLSHSDDQTVQLDFRVQLSAASGPRGLLILRFGGFGGFGVNFVFYVGLGVDLSFFVVSVDLCVIVLDHFEFFCKSAKKHIICVFC